MALSVVNTPALETLLSLDWPTIQFAQFEHDEKYHPEISRLPVQDRLRHMTLHFAKYAGRLHQDLTGLEFKRLVVDSLIIGVSCANILNIDLSKAPIGASAVPGSEFVRQLTISAGEMAAACERLDHLEDFPFRRALTEQLLTIIGSSLGVFQAEGWSPVEEARQRLAPLKAKKLFHGKL